MKGKMPEKMYPNQNRRESLKISKTTYYVSLCKMVRQGSEG